MSKDSRSRCPARAHLGERGKDPRRLPLFAFGGAGPVHGYRVAEILRLPSVIAPFGAGLGSTFGLLVAPLAFDFVRSAYSRLDQLDWSLANELLGDMAEEGRAILERSGVQGSDVTYRRTADMRYVGQGHEVSVPLPDGPLGADKAHTIEESFDSTYRQRYGRAGPEVPLEIINWRLVASGPPPTLDMRLPRRGGERGTAEPRGTREAYSPERGGYVEMPVYDRYTLAPGASFNGPAIVEERESTLIIGDRGRAQVDQQLNIVVDVSRG